MCVECRSGSSRIGITGLDEEGNDDVRCGGEKVVTWSKVESLLLSTKDVPLEMKDEGLRLLKTQWESLSLKELLLEGVVNMEFKLSDASLVSNFFPKERSLFLHDASFLFMSR